MPRVTHVKKARKDIPHAGIKAGEPYYWWKFKNCGKSVSKNYPKRSQLTRSEYYKFVYDLQDDNGTTPDFDDLQGKIEDIVSSLEDNKSEQEDKLNNMPESLRYAPSGETIQERIDNLDDAISELQSITIDEDFDDGLDEEALEAAKVERADEVWSSVADAISNL